MPPRTRKKAKLEHVESLETTKAIDSSHTAVVRAEPEPRRVQTRRGSLNNLMDYAVEIQLEVFGNLHPQDLYNLSRSCKTFRLFFMHRSNERLWKASLDNATDLPELPPFLSIPAFVHLLYAPYCHNCGGGNVRKVFCWWFARYCNKCLYEVSYSFDRAAKKAGRVDPWLARFSHVDMMVVVLPKSKASKDGRQRVLIKDHDERIARWHDLAQPVPWWAFQEWQEKQRPQLTERRKYAQLCERWFAEQSKLHANDLKVAREHRFSQIVSRLKESGWEEEVDFLGESGLAKMSKLPVVRQSVKLTERGWEQVLHAISDLLNETRRARLDSAHAVVLRERFAMLDQAVNEYYVQLPRTASMDIHPQTIDFALLKKCRTIADAPDSKVVTVNDFAKVIPALGSSWEASRRKELKAILMRDLEQVSDDVDPFKLAMGFFFCKSGHATYYPDILVHICARNIGMETVQKKYADDLYATTAATWKHHKTEIDTLVDRCENYKLQNIYTPFTLEFVSDWEHTARAKKIMRKIIMAAGLVPSCATIEDLERCPVRLRCVECREGRSMDLNKTYEWKTAFEHSTFYMNHRVTIQHDKWERIPAQDMSKVKRLEAKRDTSLLDHGDAIWSCSLCVQWDGIFEHITEHLRSEHQIENPEECEKDGRIYINKGLTTAFAKDCRVNLADQE